jgi:hypothetical protein
MPIIEERYFNAKGQMLARTKTPLITKLHAYWYDLGTRVERVSYHRYEGKRGFCFNLKDGTIRIVILGREVETQAAPTGSTVESITNAAH